MNAQGFQKIVEARANERVQEKIRTFKKGVADILNAFSGRCYCDENNSLTSHRRAIVAIMASEDHSKGWPKSLWENERTAVEKELLSIMDEMQKALLAADRSEPGENEIEVTP